MPALYPDAGDVTAIIYGEAPGPRGADKSGFPFFGDRSGKLVYRALIEAGRCAIGVDLDAVKWDGAVMRAAGYAPRVTRTALSNAFDVCPTDDGVKFRAPSRAELTSEANLARVRSEIDRAVARGLRSVIVLGKHADWLLGGKLALREDARVAYHAIVHPSPLGLMWLLRQRRVTMKETELEWMRMFREMLGD